MKILSKLSKCVPLIAAVTLLFSVSLLSAVSAEEKSQDAEYYKYVRRAEAYNKQITQFSRSAVATYALNSDDTEKPVDSGKTVVRKGIDISQWNGTIDWKTVKNSGVEFVFIRAAFRQYGDGELKDDPEAVENLKAAKAAGLDVGAYVYSQAITQTEAREEAQRVISVVSKSGVKLDLPIVLDYEYDPDLVGRLYNKHLSVTAVTGICKAFAAEAKAKGYAPMIYANRSMFSDQMDSLQVEAVSQIWLAEWETTKPKYVGAYDVWQYSETGKVTGIDGFVDMNYQYIPRIERALTGGAVVTPGAPDPTPVIPPNTDVFSNSMVTYIPVTAQMGKVISDYVNVRKGPGTKYYKLGVAYTNHEFTVNGKYTDSNGLLWYRVKITLNGVSKTAYISSEYVCLKSEIPKAPVLKQTTQTISSIKLRWSSVAGASAYKIFRYDTKTGKYAKIATVAAGTLSYTDRGLISYKKQKYYVRAIKYKSGYEIKSLKSNVRIGYTGGVRGYVNKTNGLNVYSSSTSSTVRCRLNYNERVNIIKTVGTRYKVYYDHDSTTKLGYVSKNYIRTN